MTRHKDVQNGFADLSPSFNPWLASAGPMFEATAQLTAKMCQGVAEIGKELAEFTTQRAREDLMFPARLAKCKAPQDIQQLYMEFWTTAFAQYQSEFGRLAKLNKAFGQATATKLGQAVVKTSDIRAAA